MSDQSSLDLLKLLQLEFAFAQFIMHIFPDNVQYINTILKTTTDLVKLWSKNRLTKDSMRMMVWVLTLPLDSMSLSVLELSSLPDLMKYMSLQSQKNVAIKIVQSVVTHWWDVDGWQVPLSVETEAMVKLVFSFLHPLLMDSEDLDLDWFEIEEEAMGISWLLHLVKHQSEDQLAELLLLWGPFLE